MRNPLPSQAELRELLDYDSDGFLRWKHTNRQKRAGNIAGMTDLDGYHRIKINRKLYSAHRLIYAWHHGSCPESLDHINRDRSDNRIENLRPATLSQQQFNKASPGNSSGHKNIYLQPCGTYRVSIGANGEHHRKVLPTLSEAIDYANHLRTKLHGQFANSR